MVLLFCKVFNVLGDVIECFGLLNWWDSFFMRFIVRNLCWLILEDYISIVFIIGW